MKAFKRFLSAVLVIITLMGTLPAISLMAAAATTNITDNYALDHMDYLGYDIYTQIDKGNLFGSDDYSNTVQGSKTKNSDGEWESNLKWDETEIIYGGDSSGTTGLEDIADSSTITGRAPDVDYWRESTTLNIKTRGLVCASYTASFYMNYLVNIKGGFQEGDAGWADMADAMEAAIKKYGNVQAAASWGKGLDYLVAQFEADPNLTYNGYRIVEYVYGDAEDAYENMVPGDLVLFYNKQGTCVHTSIYLGEGGSISNYGFAEYSPNGKMHWISNIVAAGIGPDVLEVYIKSYISEDGDVDSSVDADKAGLPVFYHFEYVGSGSIEVYKEDATTSDALAGAVFTAVNSDTGTKYTIGPTNGGQ